MADTPHQLVVMGSGETTPTMVTPHQRILAPFGDAPDAVLLNTPYGFQENVGDITAKTLQYFSHNVGTQVRALDLHRPGDQPDVEVETATAAVRDADWVFVGPGSPTYLVRQLAGTRVPAALRDRLTGGPGVTVVSSAAAVTIGTHAIPVYEIYKAGMDPFWVEGLGLLPQIGLDAVLVPHYDNAEGGGHDTRYCYMGERRIRRMQEQLPDGTWILGVDEHTALVADLDTRRLEVVGRGGVTVRRPDGVEHVVRSGMRTTLDELVALGEGRGSGGGAPPTAPVAPAGDAEPAEPADDGGADPLAEQVETLRTRFRTALDDGDATAATQAVLELEQTVRAWAADTLTGDQLDDAVATLRQLVTRLGTVAGTGLRDDAALVGPFVELLLRVRDGARERQDFDTADAVRDGLVDNGVEVRDTPDGTQWQLDG